MSDLGPLFDTSPEADVEDALSVWTPMEAQPGEELMRQGDTDPALVYILSGHVEILRGGFAIDTSGPGEIVGEVSLFTGKPRMATVRALEPTRFLVVDLASYERLRDRANRVAFQLERLVLDQQSHRLRRLDQLVADYAEGTANPWLEPKPGLLQRWSALFARQAPPPPPTPPQLDVQAVLESCPMFDGERWAFVRGLVGAWRTERHPAGTFVCTQGEGGDAMYVLARGAVDVVVGVSGDEEGARIQRLAKLGPGDAFGLTGLYDGRPRAASCVATEEVDLLALDREHWDELYSAHSQVGSTMRRAAIRAFGAQLQDAGSAYLQAVGAHTVPVAPNLPPPEPLGDDDLSEEIELDYDTGEHGAVAIAVPGLATPGPKLAFRAVRADDVAEPPMLLRARLETLRRPAPVKLATEKLDDQ